MACPGPVGSLSDGVVLHWGVGASRFSPLLLPCPRSSLTPSLTPDRPPSVPALLCRSGQARFYLPLSQIERVYPMVHLPAARQGGPRVHLRGETLDVQDTRGWWAQPPAEPEAAQRLIVVTRPRREAWWVDEVGPVADVPDGAPHAVLDGQVLPVVWRP